MATYESFLSRFESDTNAITVDLLADMLFFVPGGAILVEDNSAMNYDFGNGAGFLFFSESGLSAPWTGRINTIVGYFESEAKTVADGLDIDAAVLSAAIADGDAAQINDLLWSGNDRIFGGDSEDVLRGYAGIDVLNGGAGDDTLIGDAGRDVLIGGTDDDNLFGGAGNDRLAGGTGIDVLSGGTGDDVLIGGGGRDTLTGGTGADRFSYLTLFQLKGSGSEIITDFTRSQGDKIDLSAIDANAALAGNQAFTFFDDTSGNDTAIAPGTLIISNAGFMGGGPDLFSVKLSADGATSYEFFVAAIDGVLTANDFIL